MSEQPRPMSRAKRMTIVNGILVFVVLVVVLQLWLLTVTVNSFLGGDSKQGYLVRAPGHRLEPRQLDGNRPLPGIVVDEFGDPADTERLDPARTTERHVEFRGQGERISHPQAHGVSEWRTDHDLVRSGVRAAFQHVEHLRAGVDAAPAGAGRYMKNLMTVRCPARRLVPRVWMKSCGFIHSLNSAVLR